MPQMYDWSMPSCKMRMLLAAPRLGGSTMDKRYRLFLQELALVTDKAVHRFIGCIINHWEV